MTTIGDATGSFNRFKLDSEVSAAKERIHSLAYGPRITQEEQWISRMASEVEGPGSIGPEYGPYYADESPDVDSIIRRLRIAREDVDAAVRNAENFRASDDMNSAVFAANAVDAALGPLMGVRTDMYSGGWASESQEISLMQAQPSMYSGPPPSESAEDQGPPLPPSDGTPGEAGDEGRWPELKARPTKPVVTGGLPTKQRVEALLYTKSRAH